MELIHIDKLKFLIEVEMRRGKSFIESIHYRAGQLGCNPVFLSSILNGREMSKAFKKEVDELYELHEKAQKVTARFNYPADISELVH